MLKNFNSNDFYRIIDANINRAKEGLRVLEEFNRFILDNRQLTLNLKKIRHNLQAIINRLPVNKFLLIEKRNSLRDIGKNILANETERSNYLDILLANLGRIKESVRVLEEFSKLIEKKAALDFKKIRYAVYEIEKKIISKVKALRNFK